MKKKNIIIVVIAVFAILLLLACNGGTPVTTCEHTGIGTEIMLVSQEITSERLAEMVTIGEIPADVEHLFLSNNQISDIDALSGVEDTMFLDLSDNPITDWSPVSHIDIVNGRP